MEKSLPVAERPRRPEWMKVRAPSADSRYFDVKKLMHGASLHTICEEARCPNIAECWGRGHGDVPDPRRHLHARLPLLLRPLGQARARRPTRSSRSASRRRRRRWGSRTSSSPRSTATTSPTAARGTTRRRSARSSAKLPGGDGRDPDARLPRRRGGGARDRARRAARGLQPQHRDRAPAPPRACAARRRATTRRSGCCARAKEVADYPVLTKSGIIVGLGETNDEVVETMRDLRAHGVDVVTIGQYLQPLAEARGDRPLGAPRRVPLVPRAGRGARLRLGLLRAARPLVATAPTSSATRPRPAAARSRTEGEASLAPTRGAARRRPLVFVVGVELAT